MKIQLIESGVAFAVKPITCRPLLAHHAAKRLGLSPRMVRHLAKTKKLRGFKSGRKIWLFMAEEVEKFRAKREARNV